MIDAAKIGRAALRAASHQGMSYSAQPWGSFDFDFGGMSASIGHLGNFSYWMVIHVNETSTIDVRSDRNRFWFVERPSDELLMELVLRVDWSVC